MQITGIILAGGKSTRMGTDKALIQIAGKTLLERVIEVCRPICSEIIISSNNPEHDKSGYQIIPDEIHNCGPIGGIYSCLKKSETNWNFIVSVDTPFVTSDFIQFLAGQTENCDVVVPVHSGEKEPLIALYNKNCLREVQKQIEHREYKMHHLIAKLNARYVDTFEWVGKTPLLFKNLNRPDDL
jgi:molybdopterin-guanine dinucleotide biosynthesis protein A